MACKDCIHDGVCRFKDTCEVNACNNFKNKSLFVKMPCKVGDRLYETTNGKIESFIVTEIKNNLGIVLPIDALCEDFLLNVEDVELGDDNWSVGFEYGDIESEDDNGWAFARSSFYCFGKTLFCTRKEAKKALKESENK